jgi:hypothetical protein
MLDTSSGTTAHPLDPGTTRRPGARPAPGPAALVRCPFHDGVATLDLLLAELDPGDKPLFDAALDLRSLCAGANDAAACLEQLFRVRRLLDERHYLAFYRVRCWARRRLRVEIRAGRGAPWISRELPLDCARLDELINAALADVNLSGASAGMAQVRFVFAAAAARALIA